MPGHNKFDFAYAYDERKPAVTFTAFSCNEVEAFLRLPPEDQQARARVPSFVYAAPVLQMLDPTFLRLYQPHRVALVEDGHGVGHPIGCWFIREGAQIPAVWQVARQ